MEKIKHMRTKKFKTRTDFLLPRNNFLVGMGSVLNIAGKYFDYKYSRTGLEADAKALRSDWEMVGNDLRDAKQGFEKKYSKELCLK